MLKHKGEKIVAYWMGDIVMGCIFPIFFAPKEKQAAMVEKLVKETLPTGLAKLDKLMCGTKFICGNMLTQYDF